MNSEFDKLWKNGSKKDMLRMLGSIEGIDSVKSIAEAVQKPVPRFVEFNLHNDSDMIFVVPTADSRGEHARRFLENIGKTPVIFSESSGTGFNYSYSCNRVIDRAMENGYKWIIVSNDDIVIEESLARFQEALEPLGRNRVYTPKANGSVNSFYHGETFSVFKGSIPLLLLEIYNLRFINKVNGMDLSTITFFMRAFPQMKRFEKYQVAVNHTIDVWGKIGSKVTPRIINFADFGIFPSEVLKKHRFDETFFNGKEDYDLAIRLHLAGIRIEKLDLDVKSIGSGTFSRLNPSLIKEAYNNIYFGLKMEFLGL